MARVRMLRLAASPAGVRDKGETYEVDPEEAEALVEVGAAEYASQTAPGATQRGASQTAAVNPPETAAHPEPADRPADAGARPVEAVDGVGPERAEALADLGIETVAQLAAADLEELQQVDGVGPATSEKLRDAARELLS